MIQLFEDAATVKPQDVSNSSAYSETLVLGDSGTLTEAYLYAYHRTEGVILIAGSPMPIVDAGARQVTLELTTDDLIYPGQIDIQVEAVFADSSTARFPGLGQGLRINSQGETRVNDRGTLLQAVADAKGFARAASQIIDDLDIDGAVIDEADLPDAAANASAIYYVINQDAFYQSDGSTWTVVSGSGSAVVGGTIEATPIGQTTPDVGTFTDLTATTSVSFPAASITNAMLANPGLTFSPAGGISGGGFTELGGTVALSVTVDDQTLEVLSDTVRVKNDGITTFQLAPAAVETSNIADGNVTNIKLREDSIGIATNDGLAGGGTFALGTTANLSADVDNMTLEADAISLRIKDGGVDTAQLAERAVETSKVLDGAITNPKLSNDSITVNASAGLTGGGQVALGSTVALSVTVDDQTLEVLSDTVRVKNDGITTFQLAPAAVETSNIADGNVTNIKLREDSIGIATNDGLAGGGTFALGTTANLSADVDNMTLEADAISLRIKDGGVDTAQLAERAVETSKVLDGAITNPKLSNDSITVNASAGLTGGGQVALGSTVFLAALGDNTSIVVTDGTIQVADGGITTPKLAPEAVTDAKLASLADIDVNGGEIDGTPIGFDVPQTGVFTTLQATQATTLQSTLDVTGTATMSAGLVAESTVDVAGLATFTGGVELGSYLLPDQPYARSIGSPSNKFLTLHAAELRVANLVSANELVTQGGRQVVGTSTELIADVSPGATTIDVKLNNLGNDDWVRLESGGDYEEMQITSSPTSITGGYRYTVARDQDGTGANAWAAGDAVFNLGAQPGYAFIDQYAIEALYTGTTTAGPATVHMVRTGTARQAIEPRLAAGNLNGWYGFGTDTYGIAAGDENAGNLIATADTVALRSGTTAIIELDSAGDAFIQNTLTIGTSGEITNPGESFRIDEDGFTVLPDLTNFFASESYKFKNSTTGGTMGALELVGDVAERALRFRVSELGGDGATRIVLDAISNAPTGGIELLAGTQGLLLDVTGPVTADFEGDYTLTAGKFDTPVAYDVDVWGTITFQIGQTSTGTTRTVVMDSEATWPLDVNMDANFSNGVRMGSLPTTDPGVPGQLWDDAGTVKISQ